MENSNPEFSGQCAFALSTGKLGVDGSAKHALSDNGKTYYFKNPVARLLWRLLPGRPEKAEANWADRARS